MDKKIGPNTKCPCQSGKKYKVCCLRKTIEKNNNKDRLLTDGHEITSKEIQEVSDELQSMYKDHKVIDVTNILNTDSYRPIQVRNYKEKTIMIAQRNDGNNEVFSSRGPEKVNIMVMYRGAFQCFEYEKYQLAMREICNMIDLRLSGKELQKPN